MKHVHVITTTVPVAKASDAAGQIFFQIWLSVFTWILTGALGSKGD